MKNNNKFNLKKGLALIGVLAISVSFAVSCAENKGDPEPCTNHIDANGDTLCDNCGEKTSPQASAPAEEVVLNVTSAVMDVYEELSLSIVSGMGGEPVYESLHPNIATVDANGVVRSISAGVCEIKVTNDNGTVSCYITVENSYSAPVLMLSTGNVRLSKGDEYVLSPVLKYKGEDITDKATFEFSLLGENQTGVLTKVQNGNVATFTASEFGNASYAVYVEYNGVQVSKVIDFTVKQMGITFDALNMTPIKGGYAVDLSLFGAVGYITELLPEVNVVDDKTIVEDAVVTYESEDTDIVKIEADGRFVPVSSGTTTIVGTYAGNSFNITVNAIKPTISIVALNPVAEVGRLSAIEFDSALVGDFESAYIGGVSVGDSIVDGKFNLSKTGLENMPISSFGAPVELVINTSKVSYVSDVEIYSLIIKNEADYQSIGELSKAMFKDDDMMFGGYFKLGNNITVTEGMNEFINRSGAQNGIAGDGSQGFCGVFDGDGYIIDGLSRTSGAGNAFITTMHRNGVIKNIGFTNIVFASNGGSFLIQTGAGTIQDVYVQYKEISLSSSWSGTVMSASVTVERMIIDASKATIDTNGKGFSLVTCSYGSFKIVDNSFAAILPEGYTFPSGNTYYNPEICNIAGNNTVLNSLAFYNYASIKQANENVYNSICTWSPFIWHLDEATGVVTFGKNS